MLVRVIISWARLYRYIQLCGAAIWCDTGHLQWAAVDSPSELRVCTTLLVHSATSYLLLGPAGLLEDEPGDSLGVGHVCGQVAHCRLTQQSGRSEAGRAALRTALRSTTAATHRANTRLGHHNSRSNAWLAQRWRNVLSVPSICSLCSISPVAHSEAPRVKSLREPLHCV